MSKPTIAQKAPAAVELEAGKTYWWCACGQSKNQPFCDGSHKGTEFSPQKLVAEKDGKAWLCQCKHSGKGAFCDGTHKTL